MRVFSLVSALVCSSIILAACSRSQDSDGISGKDKTNSGDQAAAVSEASGQASGILPQSQAITHQNVTPTSEETATSAESKSEMEAKSYTIAAKSGEKTNSTPMPAPKVKSLAPPSGVAETNGIVFVSVFIDVKAEKIRLPEATAMLRTKGLLRKTFPRLPKQFSLRGRVTQNGYDDDDEDERVYIYRSEYKRKDIEAIFEPQDKTME